MSERTNPEAGYSAIMGMSVRVSGAVPIRVDAHHIGTPEQEVALTLGSVLVYMRSRQTAAAVVQGWRSAAVAAQCLGPARPLRDHRAALVSVMGSQVSALVRLGGLPTVTAAPVPRQKGTPTPTHVRIQVGPLVWQVCDWNAYERIAEGWRRGLRILSAAD